MGLLHISINAAKPQKIAEFLAKILGGKSMPFPPFPDSWIAFSQADDGTAIEVYPLTHVLTAGTTQVGCVVGPAKADESFAHAAIGSVLDREQIIALAEAEGWTARICNRGPFECVEVWLENRLLVEILDAQMQNDYVSGMTIANWTSMFGFEG